MQTFTEVVLTENGQNIIVRVQTADPVAAKAEAMKLHPQGTVVRTVKGQS